MLHIIIMVLKIIGLLLLAVVGLLLLMLCLFLLVPVRYRLQGSKYEEIKAEARITWLFRAVSLWLTYDGQVDFAVKVLGFRLFSGEGEEEPEPEDLYSEEAADPAWETLARDERVQAEPGRQPAERAQGERSQAADEAYGHQELPPLKEKSGGEKEKPPGEKAEPGQPRAEKPEPGRQPEKGPGLRDKLAAVKERKDQIQAFLENRDNQETILLILRQMKKLIRHILPQKIETDLVFGFEDPATTGQVLALCSIPYAWYGDDFQVTPVFDESILEGRITVKGRVRMGTLAFLVLRIFLNKNFRILVKRWRKNGGL